MAKINKIVLKDYDSKFVKLSISNSAKLNSSGSIKIGSPEKMYNELYDLIKIMNKAAVSEGYMPDSLKSLKKSKIKPYFKKLVSLIKAVEKIQKIDFELYLKIRKQLKGFSLKL